MESPRSRPERRSAVDEVKRARQDYKRLGTVAGDEARKLAARFQAACDRVLAWASPPEPDRTARIAGKAE